MEASIGSYYSPLEKADVPFTPPRWEFVGRTILQSMVDYLQMLPDPRKKDLKNEHPLKHKRLPQLKPKSGLSSSPEAPASRLSSF